MDRERRVRSLRSHSPLSLVRCCREAVASPNRRRCSRSRIVRRCARVRIRPITSWVALERESHVPTCDARRARLLRDVNPGEARRSSRGARGTRRQCELRRAQRPNAIRAAGDEVVRAFARKGLSSNLRRRDGRHERRSPDVAQAREQFIDVSASDGHRSRSSQALGTLPHVAPSYAAGGRTPWIDRSDRGATPATLPCRRVAGTRPEGRRHASSQPRTTQQGRQLAVGVRHCGRRI